MKFKDWLTFNEESFKEEEIPPYFYVGIRLTQDLIAKYPFTPPGAVATLVKVEGVSDKAHIMSSFFHGGMALQMPGKAFVRLNRVSKELYKNPDYNTSFGFRAIRRVRAGIQSRVDRSTIIYDIVNLLFHRINESFPAFKGSGVETLSHDGFEITVQDVVNGLKKLKPLTGVIQGKEKQHKKLWGTTKETGAKNIKPHLKHKSGDNLHNIKNLNDFTNRLVYIFRGMPGLEELLLKPSGAISWIKNALQEIITQFSGYDSESEWLIKNSHVRTFAARCPDCGYENVVEPHLQGTSLKCRKCRKEFEINYPSIKALTRNLLNVPEGSVLYIGRDIFSLPMPSFIKGMVAEWRQSHPNDDYPEALVKALKLDDKFTVYFVKNGNEAQSIASKKITKTPFDPQKVDMQEKVMTAIKKGVTNVGLLAKFLEKKEGITPARLKAYLDRLVSRGAIKIDGNTLTLLKPEYDDNEENIFEILKDSQYDMTSSEISNKMQMGVGEVEKYLQKLKKDGRATENKNVWKPAFTDADRNNLSSEEDSFMKCLEKGHEREYAIRDCAEFDNDEFKKILRLLTLKGKVYRGVHSTSVRVMPQGELSSQERDLLHYLKKFPETDIYSLRDDQANRLIAGMDYEDLMEPLESLAARGLVDISGTEVTLKTEPHEGHSKLSVLAEKLVNIAKKHFITSIHGFNKFLSDTTEYAVNVARSLINREILRSENDRYVVDGSVPWQDTVEAKLVLDTLSIKKHCTVEDLGGGELLPLLYELEKAGIIGKTFSLKRQEDIYYLPSDPYEENTLVEQKRILAVISQIGYPTETALITKNLPDLEQVYYVLEEMVTKKKLKMTNELQGGYEIYALLDMEFKNFEFYQEIILEYVKANAIVTERMIIEYMKKYGLLNTTRAIIAEMSSDNVVYRTFDSSFNAVIVSVVSGHENLLVFLNKMIDDMFKEKNAVVVTSNDFAIYMREKGYEGMDTTHLRDEGLISMGLGPDNKWYVGRPEFDVDVYFGNMLVQFLKSHGGETGWVSVEDWNKYLTSQGFQYGDSKFITRAKTEYTIYFDKHYGPTVMTLSHPNMIAKPPDQQ